ncbi:Arc family DNA-binding protein [Caballeronia sp. dw_19]|uniref:Arc family DNA-binding protein n=1 Tax=Caballeronia sp. dw_19 TaxID=2719791 RepID=UPI001BD0557C|nr:Arc family DNA-binding protein [Caballeronia sp. dw_19]
MDADKQSRITLRLPGDLHHQLELEADASHRSLNGEIVARLSSTFTGRNFVLPASLRDAIEARARASSTTFEEEVVRTLAAGLGRKAPAVLVVDISDGIPLSKIGTLLDEARERLPAETAVWIGAKKPK